MCRHSQNALPPALWPEMALKKQHTTSPSSSLLINYSEKGWIVHSQILPFRVSINCVRYKRAGGRVGGRMKLFWKQMRENLGESKSRHIGHCQCGPQQGSELQGKSDDNRGSFHSAAVSFLLPHWLTAEKWTPAHCLRRTCVFAPFAQRPMAFSCL